MFCFQLNSVVLTDGTELPADLCLLGVGQYSQTLSYLQQPGFSIIGGYRQKSPLILPLTSFVSYLINVIVHCLGQRLPLYSLRRLLKKILKPLSTWLPLFFTMTTTSTPLSLPGPHLSLWLPLTPHLSPWQPLAPHPSPRQPPAPHSSLSVLQNIYHHDYHWRHTYYKEYHEHHTHHCDCHWYHTHHHNYH